jgi:hypothetical protein
MNKRVDSEILSATENTELQSAIEKPADLITAPDALLTQPASKERKLAKGKRKGEAKEEAEEASAEGEQAEGGSAGGASEASDDNTGEMLAQAPKPTQKAQLPRALPPEKPVQAQAAWLPRPQAQPRQQA